jgi:hypothetical protein
MATPREYPTGIKVYIDDEDITRLAFGEDTITLTEFDNAWRDIDITPYLKYAGLHKLRITAEAGVGRVDAKITIR